MSKFALVTEWNGRYGGAENVNIQICKLFKEYPDVYSIWNENPDLVTKKDSPIRFFRSAPKQVTGLLSLFYQTYALSKSYKLVIGSSFMYAHLKRSRDKMAKHLVYVHTPIRYIWSPGIDKRASDWSFVFSFISPILKRLELYFLDRDALFVCNSYEVSARVAKSWGITASVIYPPVDVAFFKHFLKTEVPPSLQLISAGRFVKYKNHDVAIEIAEKLNCKLILAGSGPDEGRLRELANQKGLDVDFIISPSRGDLAHVISNSSVYLHLAHEDFGILPIEAMSTGTPVVGFNIGGLSETVNLANGRLCGDFKELGSAIEEATLLDRLHVSRTVDAYSPERFSRQMKKAIVSRWPEFASDLSATGAED